MPLTSGELINNRYRIVRLLGQGGFGAVYRAWDTHLDEPVALKQSFETSPSAQRQFQLEAKLLFKLHHANLPRVHDFFIIAKQGMYLVMDYIEGEDLEKMLQKSNGPLPEAQVLEWAIQVCDALEYLHSQNPPIVHRDIKPANIRITPLGKAILVDFGIAKVFDPTLKTTVGAQAVTPGFSPPEQYGKGPTDARSDIYALGATLYSLLTQQTPPDSVDVTCENVPAPPIITALNPAVSSSVSEAVEMAMRLNRRERFASANEFKHALMQSNVHYALFTPKTALASQVTSIAPIHQSIHQRINESTVKILLSALTTFVLAVGVLVVLIFMLNKNNDMGPIGLITTSIPTNNLVLLHKTTEWKATATPMLIVTAMHTSNPYVIRETANLEATATPKPVITNTPIPQFSPTSRVHKITAIPVVVARYPGNRDVAAASLWKLVPYQDLHQPGNQTYSVEIPNDQQLRWGFNWCATSARLLKDILQPLSIRFLIDSTPISSQNMMEYEDTASNGWICHRWLTLLSEWSEGAMIQLEIAYSLSDSIYDGSESYPPGSYRQILYVTVK